MIVSVPSPSIRAPIARRHATRSAISGSRAAFLRTVVPRASVAAITTFSVAPTLAKRCSITAPFSPPAAGKHIYELRTYQTHLGRTPEWVNNFKEALPTRGKYSSPVCLWTTDIGETLNQVVHLWAYDDLNQRASVRNAALADPGWQAFLGKSAPLIADMQSMVMLPTATSPLQ